MVKHIIDDLYDSMGERVSFFSYIKNSVHLVFCSSCAEEAHKLELAETVMKDLFPSLPVSSNFEESIMKQIDALPEISAHDAEHMTELSLRGWVIIGVFMLFSLTTTFFGMDFEKVANSQGQAFLLPVGITVGALLAGYGAIFIGSHLEELSKRFGLR
ncbi:MAG: peptidoglycan-binding protein [Treponema sp.]|jgi:hypothetical protein|nr:peptidoglycan-binding protein [Treponema sp.]